MPPSRLAVLCASPRRFLPVQPQTWENPKYVHPDTKSVGDNDPIDIVDIGTKQWSTGSIVSVKVLVRSCHGCMPVSPPSTSADPMGATVSLVATPAGR